MTKLHWNRRVVLAAASVTLVGGGLALPATAMAAPAAPPHSVTLAPQNDNGHGHTPGGIQGAYSKGVDINVDSESRQGVPDPPREGLGGNTNRADPDDGEAGLDTEHLPPPPPNLVIDDFTDLG